MDMEAIYVALNIESYLKNKDNLKNVDNLKNEGDLKQEDNLKNTTLVVLVFYWNYFAWLKS